MRIIVLVSKSRSKAGAASAKVDVDLENPGWPVRTARFESDVGMTGRQDAGP